MLLMRRFEEAVGRLAQDGKFAGQYHLYIGQQATGAAALSVLLKAPIHRVTRADTPVRYSPPLEAFVTPDAAKVETAVRRVLEERA